MRPLLLCRRRRGRARGRRGCSGAPAEWPGWLRDFVRDLPGAPKKWGIEPYAEAAAAAAGEGAGAEAQGYDFDAGLWPRGGEALAVRDALLGGGPQERYVPLGYCYGFPHPHDCPVDPVHGTPARLWWDPAEPAPRVLVQLGPQFPPLLWIPLVPSVAALTRLLGDVEANDTLFLEGAAPEFERALDSGMRLLEGGRGAGPPAVPWTSAGERGDLYRRAAMESPPLNRIRKEYEAGQWYFLGQTACAEEAELRAAASPFVYGRWPAAVVGGAQRRSQLPVLASVFRTLVSKSVLYFSTREDEPYSFQDLESKKYSEGSGLYCYVSHPELPRLSGGEAVVERYNRLMGTDFPLTTPVDVLGALSLWRAKAPSQVAAEYAVAAGALFDPTADVVAEVAARRRAGLSEEHRSIAERLAGAEGSLASPAAVRVCGYVRRMAIMRHPEFEGLCFRALMGHEAPHVRSSLHEACLLAGRQDLADLLLSKEQDQGVVDAICDMHARQA